MIYNDYPAVRVPVFDQYGREIPEYGIQCETTPCLTLEQARVRRVRREKQKAREEFCTFAQTLLFCFILTVLMLLIFIVGG